MESLVDAALDGTGSVWRVHNLLTANELRFEAWIAMSARGLLLTYAIPSISGVLASTGGFESDVQRRYADMELMIREFNESAADGTSEWNGQPERAQRAIQRLNAIHAAYGHLILQRDMQYVLAIFMTTPAIWCDSAWSCRAMTRREKACVHRHWMGIGRAMNIELDDGSGGDWADFDSVVAFKRKFESQHQRFKPTNFKVAVATIRYFSQQFPAGVVREAVEKLALHALAAMQEDGKHARALGFPSPPSPVLRLAIDACLRLRAFACAHLLPPLPIAWTRRLTGLHPIHSSQRPGCPFKMYAPLRALDFGNKTYGPKKPYAIEDMGPPSVQPGLLETSPNYLS